jgi:hypothetical protein
MDKKIDLYLWVAPKNDVLYKLGSISHDDADHYAMMWFEANELHEYMYVIEGSKPWSEPEPTIIDITPDWIKNELEKLENA